MRDTTSEGSLREPPAGLLSAIAMLRRDAPWDTTRATLQLLRSTTLPPADDGGDEFGHSGQAPRDLYLAWRDPNGEEIGAVYLSGNAAGQLCTVNLTWVLGAASSASADGFEPEARWLVGHLAELLGSPQAMLCDVGEGLSSSGEEDVVVARAFWPRDFRGDQRAAVTYRGAVDYDAYHDALAAARDPLTVWLVADSVRDGCTLSAMFTPFMAD